MEAPWKGFHAVAESCIFSGALWRQLETSTLTVLIAALKEDQQAC